MAETTVVSLAFSLAVAKVVRKVAVMAASSVYLKVVAMADVKVARMAMWLASMLVDV